MQELRLGLFGRPRIELDRQPLAQVIPAKGQAMLFHLATMAQPVPRSRLAWLCWSDAPEDHARASLRVALTRLRKAVGDSVLADSASVRLNPSLSITVDLAEFDDIARRASSSTAAVLSRALDLAQGDLLDGFEAPGAQAFDDWLTGERARVRRSVIDVARELVARREAEGDRTAAIAAARRWLELDDADEQAHRQLMRLLADSGRRSAAIAQYEACRRALLDVYGAKPAAETYALYRRIHMTDVRSSEPTAPDLDRDRDRSTSAVVDAAALLPAMPIEATTLIGREQAIDAVVGHLSDSDCRVLTLIGPAGVGKTRLALAVARTCAGRFAHGVAYMMVAAAPSTSIADDAVEAFATSLCITLGLPAGGARSPVDVLVRALASREMLLVLDNLERVDGAGRLLQRLVCAAPRMRVLAASRRRLGGAFEWLYEVHPLDCTVSVPGQPSAAVALFHDRARHVRPGFEADAASAAVDRICGLLGGLPLAIELAAQWVRVLPCERIAERLALDLDLLEDPSTAQGHGGMRTLLRESWQTLGATLCRDCARLSVFEGGFDAAAADAVAGVPPSRLRELVDRSWLRGSESGRLEMHPLLQRHAAAMLASAADEASETMRRHAEYFAAWIEPLVAVLGEAERPSVQAGAGGAASTPGVAGNAGVGIEGACARIESEMPNLQAALARATGAGSGLTTEHWLARLWPYLKRRGLYVDALRQHHAALDRTAMPRPLQGLWWMRIVECEYQLGRLGRVRDAYTAAAPALGLPDIDSGPRLLVQALVGSRPRALLDRWAGGDPELRDRFEIAAVLGASRISETLYFLGNLPASTGIQLATRRWWSLHGEARTTSDAAWALYFGAVPLPALARHYASRAQRTMPARPASTLAANSSIVLSVYRYQAGLWAGIADAMHATECLCRDAGLWRGVYQAGSLAGKVMLMQGRFAEAEAHFAALADEAHAVGHSMGEQFGCCGRVEAALRTGTADPAALSAWLDRAWLAMAGDQTADRAYIVRYLGLRAVVQWRAGDTAAALHTALTAARAIERARFVAMWALEGYAGTVEVLQRALSTPGDDDPDPALVHTALVGTLRSFGRFARSFPPARARHRIGLSRHLAAVGHRRRAMRAAEQALAVAQELAMPYDIARAREQIAELSDSGAAQRLGNVRQDYLANDAAVDAERCTRLIARTAASRI